MKTLLLLTLVAGVTVTISRPASAASPAPVDVFEGGQTPQPAAPPAPPAQEAAPVPPPNYSYDSTGRRDPFVSLVNRGADTRPGAPKGPRPEGIAGVMVDEVAVRGIVQSRGAWVAMIAAPNGRTYTIRPGDRLMDGAVRAITGQGVVMLQEVNDPLALEKQREVRKQLRGEVK